ncbi:MAG: class I SAM-dependent methyltransferase, partial [Planctomycetota bacterium]
MNTLLEHPTTDTPQAIDRFLDRLRCPVSGSPLHRDGSDLVNTDGSRRYPVAPGGIPHFARDPERAESLAQQRHYDRVAQGYLGNLTLPHTEEYTAYLDRILMSAAGEGTLGRIGEICCGSGEAVRLLARHRPGSFESAMGFDISARMLDAARRENPDPNVLFVQGDATALPVADGAFDTVFILGGIHHVNDRAALFTEVRRTLAPGGRLVFREPLNDFLLWRLLRGAIYKLSPALDEATERPLRERTTRSALEAAGLDVAAWQPCGLLGFCLFMNSDVLVANRLLRYVPGI